MLEVMRRDDFPPPSSRSARRVGYRFATIASLVRQERMSVREAEGLADEWMMFVRAQQRSGVDPAETAAMLGELARRRQSSRPRSSRDPARRQYLACCTADGKEYTIVASSIEDARTVARYTFPGTRQKVTPLLMRRSVVHPWMRSHPNWSSRDPARRGRKPPFPLDAAVSEGFELGYAIGYGRRTRGAPSSEITRDLRRLLERTEQFYGQEARAQVQARASYAVNEALSGRDVSRPPSSRDPARRKRARPSETVLERARRGFHRMTEEEVRDMAEAMSRPIKRPAPSRSRKVGRDPDPGRQILNRPGAGQKRISERGFPYRVCRYGLQRHALLFPLARYTMAEAKHWAREHGAPIYQVEQKANFIHIRLNKKELFVPDSFRNIELLPFKRDGVRVLVACPRLAPVRGARARGPGTRRAPARRRAA